MGRASPTATTTSSTATRVDRCASCPEYLQPLRSFRQHSVHDTVVFFGSARLREGGPMGSCYAEARELARLITEWSKQLGSPAHRFLICTGGGGGIMEAANRGARDAGGRTIGLKDLALFHVVDSPAEALDIPKRGLVTRMVPAIPAIAKSVTRGRDS